MRGARKNRSYPSKDAVNAALLQLYLGSEQSPWEELWGIRKEHMEYRVAKPPRKTFRTDVPSVGSPFLAAATQAYFDADVRVLIVGREALCYYDDKTNKAFDSAQQCMDVNEDFLGNESYTSPFWRAARRLSDELNRDQSSGTPCLAWSNVYRLDEYGSTPSARLAKRLRESVPLKSLLKRELEILKPDVLWIACGSGGDWDLDLQLDGVGRTKGERYQVIDAPHHASVVLRSDHPMGLTYKGQLDEAMSRFIEASRMLLT